MNKNTIEDGSMNFMSQDTNDGFVLLFPLVDAPQPSPVVTAPARKYSDDMIAANCRIDWGTHVAEPIHEEGKATGEWRVAKLRTRYDQPGITAPWEVVPDEKAARKWAENIRLAKPGGER